MNGNIDVPNFSNDSRPNSDSNNKVPGEREGRVQQLIRKEELYSNLRVNLENKELYLWKSVFILSNLGRRIENCEEDVLVVNNLQDLSLDVEESVILDFIERKTNFKRCTFLQLIDYFIFFKRLGMMWLAKEIVEYVHTNIRSCREIYEVFKDISERFERRGVRFWFRRDQSSLLFDRFVTPEHFTHSLTLMLFCMMRDRLNQYENTTDLYRLPYYDIVRVYLNSVDMKRYEKFSFHRHPDVTIVERADPRRDRFRLFRMLRRGILSNMFIDSSDGQRFLVHREILVLRLNFFCLMFRFEGKEVRDLEEKGGIVLEDPCHDRHFCRLLLEYVYNDEISAEERNMDVLIKTLFFAEKFCEGEFYDKLVTNMHTLRVSDRDREIELLLFDYGWKIHNSEKLKTSLLPILQNLRKGDPWKYHSRNEYPLFWGSRDELLRILRHSDQVMEMMDRLTKQLNDEKDELVAQNKELKEKVGVLEEKILGMAKKRKRDEYEEKEPQPQQQQQQQQIQIQGLCDEDLTWDIDHREDLNFLFPGNRMFPSNLVDDGFNNDNLLDNLKNVRIVVEDEDDEEEERNPKRRKIGVN